MDDYEVECIYLGKPVERREEAHENDRGSEDFLPEEDVERLYLGLPLPTVCTVS